ncbi:MAG: ribosome maturation factor RimP [Candidatus Rokuibacteriota bacterium]
MTLSDSLEAAFRSRVEALGFDLADLRIGGTPQRPLVQVRIDWPPGASRRVSVADCATVSRALEAWLDAGESGAGGLLGRRYQLEVSSPGLERPVRWHRHWTAFVGRDVTAQLPGLGRVRARIVAVPDEHTVMLEPQGAPARPVPLAEIRDARLAVDW